MGTNWTITLTGHSDEVMSAFYSPDGQRIITASHDQTIKIWDTKTGKEILTLVGHDNAVTSASYSPDGQRIISIGQDGTARLYTTKN